MVGSIVVVRYVVVVRLLLFVNLSDGGGLLEGILSRERLWWHGRYPSVVVVVLGMNLVNLVTVVSAGSLVLGTGGHWELGGLVETRWRWL